jgi:hypothetical protein
LVLRLQRMRQIDSKGNETEGFKTERFLTTAVR